MQKKCRIRLPQVFQQGRESEFRAAGGPGLQQCLWGIESGWIAPDRVDNRHHVRREPVLLDPRTLVALQLYEVEAFGGLANERRHVREHSARVHPSNGQFIAVGLTQVKAHQRVLAARECEHGFLVTGEQGFQVRFADLGHPLKR